MATLLSESLEMFTPTLLSENLEQVDGNFPWLTVLHLTLYDLSLPWIFVYFVVSLDDLSTGFNCIFAQQY